MPAPQDFEKMIRELKARITKLEQARPLSNTGLSCPAPGVTQVDGSLVVQSGEVASGDYVPGSVGWHLAANAIPEFNDIILRDLPNSMLANPVVPAAANDTGSGFAVTTAFVERAFKVLTVPDGFTTLSIMASGWVFAYNPNTSGGVDGTGTDALWCFVRIGGPSDTDSETHGQGISGNGGFTTATAGIATVKTGLTPGSTVRVGVYAGSSIAGFAAAAGNNATLSALLTWLR